MMGNMWAVFAGLALFILAMYFFVSVYAYFRRKRRKEKLRKKIIRREEPYSDKEACILEKNLSGFSSADLAAWGRYLLFSYYLKNREKGGENVFKCAAHGEIVRKEYEKFPFYVDSVFELANTYFFYSGRFEKAARIYEELLNNKPRMRWEKICRSRTKLVRENLDKPEALKLYVKAEWHFEKEKFSKAAGYLQEVTRRFPDTDIALLAFYFLGDIFYYKLKKPQEAFNYYRKACENGSERAEARDALYKCGEIMRKMKRWEKAVEIYREYLDLYKDSSFRDDAFFYIGEAYQNMGKLRKAKNAYSLVLGDYPDSKWTEVLYRRVQRLNRKLVENR